MWDGNQVLNTGKATINAKQTPIINKNGIAPRNISSTVTPSPIVLFITKTTIPKGGVSNPISIVMVATTPNQIRS